MNLLNLLILQITSAPSNFNKNCFESGRTIQQQRSRTKYLDKWLTYPTLDDIGEAMQKITLFGSKDPQALANALKARSPSKNIDHKALRRYLIHLRDIFLGEKEKTNDTKAQRLENFHKSLAKMLKLIKEDKISFLDNFKNDPKTSEKEEKKQ